MKLELKHLAPYLPYGLKCEHMVHSVPHKRISVGVGLFTRKSNGMVSLKGIKGIEQTAIKSVKPILRPLSGLTKEIEHNGDKFIPIGKLHYLVMRTPGGRKSKAQYEIIEDRDYIGTVPKHQDFSKGVRIWKHNMGKTNYFIIKKLAEWHFDFMDLIDNDLAIDMNTQ